MLSCSTQHSSRPITSTVATTPKQKSKQCICNWGNMCGEINRCLTQAQHPLGGVVEYNYSNTCNFQNSWHSINKYLFPSKDKRDHIINGFKELRKGEKCKPSGQKSQSKFSVNKHHYDLKLVEYQNNWQWSMGIPYDCPNC